MLDMNFGRTEFLSLIDNVKKLSKLDSWIQFSNVVSNMATMKNINSLLYLYNSELSSIYTLYNFVGG